MTAIQFVSIVIRIYKHSAGLLHMILSYIHQENLEETKMVLVKLQNTSVQLKEPFTNITP